MTKILAPLLLAMVASLAMVVVAQEQTQLPSCESCTSPGCFIDGYKSSLTLTEVDQDDSDVRMFQPDTTYDASAQLVANFTDSETHLFPAYARISNYYDTDVLLEIDFSDDDDDLDLSGSKKKPDVQFLKIAAKQKCSAFVADKHTSGDINSVIAFTKDDIE